MDLTKLKNFKPNLSEKNAARITAGIQLVMCMAALNGTLKKEVKGFKKTLKKRKKSKKK